MVRTVFGRLCAVPGGDGCNHDIWMTFGGNNESVWADPRSTKDAEP